MHDLSLLKILAAIAILIVAAIAGWLPFHRRFSSLKGLDFPRGEALASGVFLGAALIHMLSDSANQFQQLNIHYPLAFFLAGLSFLILLLLEHFGSEISHHGKKNSASIAIISFVMLSIHSLFAGAALGLSHYLGTVILILIAILAHKWAAGFALAIQLNKSTLSQTKRILYFTIFALMTPLGIVLGQGLASTTGAYPFIEPVLLAIASGTFLYIGTLHGLKRSVMVERCCNLKDFSFVIIGFLLMALVAIWA